MNVDQGLGLKKLESSTTMNKTAGFKFPTGRENIESST